MAFSLSLVRIVDIKSPMPTIKAVERIIPIIETKVLFLFIIKCLIVNLFKIFMAIYLLVHH